MLREASGETGLFGSSRSSKSRRERPGEMKPSSRTLELKDRSALGAPGDMTAAVVGRGWIPTRILILLRMNASGLALSTSILRALGSRSLRVWATATSWGRVIVMRSAWQQNGRVFKEVMMIASESREGSSVSRAMQFGSHSARMSPGDGDKKGDLLIPQSVDIE